MTQKHDLNLPRSNWGRNRIRKGITKDQRIACENLVLAEVERELNRDENYDMSGLQDFALAEGYSQITKFYEDFLQNKIDDYLKDEFDG